jgi:hypothetical protein
MLPLPLGSSAQTVLISPAGQQAGDFFGNGVSSAGDFNADGLDDVLIGAPGAPNGIGDGRAYIYFGSSTPDQIPDVILIGQPTSFFGTTVTLIGDYDGDGYSDIAVGAPTARKVFIYFGGPTYDVLPDVVHTGVSLAPFGSSLAGAGDINGDGLEDLIVGASTSNQAAMDTVSIFFGGSPSGSVPNLRLTSLIPGGQFGCSVAFVGDVNGDGYSDFLIGARSESSTGKAYLYFGGASPDDVADVVFSGSASLTTLGPPSPKLATSTTTPSTTSQLEPQEPILPMRELALRSYILVGWQSARCHI